MDQHVDSRFMSLKYFIMGPMQMIFSSLCFAFMSYFAKLATDTVPSQEVTFFRLALGTAAAIIIVRAQKGRLITENYKLLVTRGFFGGISVLLFFMALEKGSVTVSVVLNNTSPIFATIFAMFFLKEKVGLKLVSFLLFTFAGIVLLTRPDMGSLKLGDVFGLISGISGGFAIAAVRQLRQKNESVFTIFFYFCSFGAVISLLLAFSSWKWLNLQEGLFVLLTGILGLFGQVSMTAAYKYCKTAVGAILSMSTSIFTFTIGVLLLSESAGFFDILGVLMVVTGSAAVVLFEKVAEGSDPNAKIAKGSVPYD